jgi:hypothetical protein
MEMMMSKTTRRLSFTAALSGLLIAAAPLALAQTASDPHHPASSQSGTTQLAQPKQGQPGPGMGPSQMPGGMGMGSGMMGQGMGMMGRDTAMGPGGMMDMMSMMGGCPMMATDGQTLTFGEGRIAFLKAELAITDAQKGVWDAYAEVTKRNLQGMGQMMGAMLGAKTSVERLDARLTAMESRVNALKEVKPALAKLYDALSAEQKKKADAILTGMGCMM